MTGTIDPERLYPLKPCAALIASTRGEGTVSPKTLQLWARTGTIRTVKIGGRYYLPGAELLRLTRAPGDTRCELPAQVEGRRRVAAARLGAHGL